MSRTLTINPVTRIEGHAKVHLEIGDDGKVEAAYFHVLEFRGFERFVQGMQVELMPTITTRICGTCPHAHHLVGAKAVDKVFSVEPPRPARLLRELLNAGSIIHSHAIHFFALAGPDLILGLDAPVAKRNLVGLLEAAPELAAKALRLRSLGQRIAETVGGRGTHPVTAVAGGMAAPLDVERRETLRKLAAEALEIARLALKEGKLALNSRKELLSALPLKVHDMGTVQGDRLDLYDGALRVRRPDGSVAVGMPVDDYRKHIFEQAVPHSYAKQTLFRDPKGGNVPYRVGPLARLNCAKSTGTPIADEELGKFKEKLGDPCPFTVMSHYARLIELVHEAEKAVALLDDDDIVSPDVRTPITATPKSAVAHVEAPRGVLIHDYDVDSNGIMRGANLLVATQHNVSCINASIKAAAELFMSRPEEELLNGVEFAVRCWDPCLSCSTHEVGRMPLDIEITKDGEVVRRVRRS